MNFPEQALSYEMPPDTGEKKQKRSMINVC